MRRMQAERACAVRAAFAAQEAACRRLGSPFTADLLDLLAHRLDETSALGARCLDWPGDPRADALALRAAAALHARALTGADPELSAVYPPQEATREEVAQAALRAAAGGDDLAAWLNSPPQTNETARASALGPALADALATLGSADAPPPIALWELGASAGLNLRFDLFDVSVGGVQWGPGDSLVRLSPDSRGAPPPAPPAGLRIVSRDGCDRSPLDPACDRDRLRLRAYLWPDQPERRARLDGALDLAAAHPATVSASTAGEWIASALQRRPTGVATVVFHTIFWQYAPAAEKALITSALEAAGRTATQDTPLIWLSVEDPAVWGRGALDPGGAGALIARRVWPGDGAFKPLGRLDYHGRWLRWGVGAATSDRADVHH